MRERHASSEAVLAHLADVGPLLPLLVELGGGLRVEVFGDPSPELRAATAELGPTIYRQVLAP